MLTKRLKMLREEAGYTQRALSERLNLSDARYNQYETGKRSPDFEILTEIANFYGVTTDYLLSVSDIRNPYEPDTIAAHKDGAEWSDEELEAIENFKETVRRLRQNRKE